MTQKQNSDILSQLTGALATSDADELEGAIRRLQVRLDDLNDADYRRAVDALCSLFYIDTSDRPDLEEPVDEAAVVLAGQGRRVVPLLLRQMEGSDLKSHLYLARVLGQIGCDALAPLRNLLATAEDPYARAFAMYAIGKMTCPEAIGALPEVLGGLMHPDKEVRDTAARTLGKLAVSAPADNLTTRRRQEMFEALRRAARDLQPPVRAKALRSLGKMAGAGLLTEAYLRDLREMVRGALGEGETSTWDNAFIVRREAKAVLIELESAPVDPPNRPSAKESRSRKPRSGRPAPDA